MPIMIPKAYRIRNQVYYMADDLLHLPNASLFFKGCETARKCVAFHTIPSDDYLYAYKSKCTHTWLASTVSNKRASLFLKKDYVHRCVLHNAHPMRTRASTTHSSRSNTTPSMEYEQHLDVENVYHPIEEDCKVLAKSVSPISCIYLIRITRACYADFVDDDHEDHYVFKFGKTKDLVRRIYELIKIYGSMTHVRMSLETFSTVDPSDLTKAEADIRTDFKNNGMLVSHTVHKELVLVPDDTIMDVRKQYSHMCDVYASYNVDISTKLKQTEKIVDNIVSTLVQSVNRPIVE